MLGLVSLLGLLSQAAAPAPLVFAKVPSDGDAEKLAVRYGRLTRALGAHLGRPVIFQTRGSYEAIAEGMGRGAFDVVSVGPALFLSHEGRYTAVAKPVRFNRAAYRGLLLVRANAPYRRLADLRGKLLGFVSPSSTSGYWLPAALLKQQGLVEGRDYRSQFFGGKHPDVAKAVTEGRVDAGAIYDDARVDAYGDDQGLIQRSRVLAATPMIPNDPVAVKRTLPPALRSQIQAFFLTVHQDPQASDILAPLDENVSRWEKASDAEYAPIRSLRQALEGVERGRR